MQIYLDHNSSTALDPRARDAMLPFLGEHFGNPSTHHWAATESRRALGEARERIASLLGAKPAEIIFTSGGSESNNYAIKGLLLGLHLAGSGPLHVITTIVEHASVLAPLAQAERFGVRVTKLPVDRWGRISAEDLRSAITPDTSLVSVMHANNEVGTLQPLGAISAICREHGVPLHTDAAQSVSKLPTRVDELGVDMLTLAGHKLYGPKGIGVLYVREGLQLEPLVDGAGHESGRRAGTENVAYAVGLGVACDIAAADMAADDDGPDSLRGVRDHFYDLLHEAFGDGVVLNGHPTERLPNTLNVSFVDRIGAEVVAGLDGVAASTGAACHDGSRKLSRVLSAMKVDERVGLGAIRFSTGRHTSRPEVEEVVRQLRATVS